MELIYTYLRARSLGLSGKHSAPAPILHPPFMFYFEAEHHEGVQVGLASLEPLLVQPPESWVLLVFQSCYRFFLPFFLIPFLSLLFSDFTMACVRVNHLPYQWSKRLRGPFQFRENLACLHSGKRPAACFWWFLSHLHSRLLFPPRISHLDPNWSSLLIFVFPLILYLFAPLSWKFSHFFFLFLLRFFFSWNHTAIF